MGRILFYPVCYFFRGDCRGVSFAQFPADQFPDCPCFPHRSEKLPATYGRHIRLLDQGVLLV